MKYQNERRKISGHFPAKGSLGHHLVRESQKNEFAEIDLPLQPTKQFKFAIEIAEFLEVTERKCSGCDDGMADSNAAEEIASNFDGEPDLRPIGNQILGGEIP